MISRSFACFFTLILLFNAAPIYPQCYENLKRDGQTLLKQAQYKEAINKFFAARSCPDKPGKDGLDNLIKTTQDRWVQEIEEARKAADAQRDAAKEAQENAESEAEKAKKARKEADELRVIAEARLRVAEASKLAFLADAERENGKFEDAFALAYTAYQLIQKDNIIPSVKQALGNAVVELFGKKVELDQAIMQTSFFPNQNHFLLIAKDHKAHLYDYEGNLKNSLSQHSDYITETIIDPNNQYFITLSKDKTANIWDASGNKVNTFSAHENAISAGIISPDGKKVATGDRSGNLLIWNVSDQKIISNSGTLHKEPILEIGLAGNSFFYSMSAKKVILQSWNGNVLNSYDHEGKIIYDIDCSKGGQYLVTGGADFNAKIWSNSGQLLHTLSGHQGIVTKVLFLERDQKILTCSSDGTLKIWDLQGNLLNTLIGHEDMVIHCGYQEENRLIISQGKGDKVILWKEATKLIELNQNQDKILSVSLSPIGNTISIANGGNEKTVKMWDLGGDVLFNQSFSQNAQVSYSSDGKYLLMASSDGTAVLTPTLEAILALIEDKQIEAPQISENLKSKYSLDLQVNE